MIAGDQKMCWELVKLEGDVQHIFFPFKVVRAFGKASCNSHPVESTAIQRAPQHKSLR